jgi:DNA-binding MarR family transcriptional regulator
VTDDPTEPSARRLPTPGIGFLMSQLGFESARRWAARLAPLGLEPREGMVLRVLDAGGAMTQADLARASRVPASKVVGLVDELEAAGLVERQSDVDDRRVRVIHLTGRGREALTALARASAAHEAELTAGLSPEERARLVDLLQRVADDAGLVRGIHPGAAEHGGPTAAQAVSDDDRG